MDSRTARYCAGCEFMYLQTSLTELLSHAVDVAYTTWPPFLKKMCIRDRVTINRLVWRPLYGLASTKYKLES